ncbi:MAG: hypothetical protein AAFU85_11200, partial [Planctomycetota bacterium]
AWVCVAILVVTSAVAKAERVHPVSVTQANAYATRESLDVKVQVFLEDLFLFHDLKPNDQDFLEPDILAAGVSKHREFLLQKFVIRDVAGEPLLGQMTEVDQTELPEEGVGLGELMAHTLVFHLRYELPSEPEFLTISQNFTDADGLIPSEMNLTVFQENAGEVYTATLKPDQPVTVRLNWNAPPLSAEASQEEREKWETKRKEEALGITSYSSVYSFLYIDDYEVRHEILIPLLTLEESVLVARDDDEFLDLDEQDAARQQIEAFFKTGNPIEIDGALVTPTVDRCDFYGLDFKDFAKQAESKRVSLASARVGIILSYKLSQPAQTVGLTWNRFNSYLWTINMVVFAFEEVSKATLSRLGSDNEYRWENPGRPRLEPIDSVIANVAPPREFSLPALSVACLALIPAALLAVAVRWFSPRACGLSVVGLLVAAAVGWPFVRVRVSDPLHSASEASNPEVDSAFASLHANIYRAFDYRDEEQVYDALAKSIDGELLQTVYLEIRRGLEMQEQGGALSRIREVAILEGGKEKPAYERPPSEHGRHVRYRSRWNVAGTVEHWGHIHARTNQYEAIFDLETRNGLWKVTGMDLLEEKRLNFETTLRSL